MTPKKNRFNCKETAKLTPVQRVELAIEEMRAGRMVIMTDDEDRENEGDLVLASEFVTPDAITFMATHGRGLICATMTKKQAERLGLPPMTRDNQSRFSTAFTVSIEAREGVTTGISAHDRARTIRVASRPDAKPEDVVSPGHVFPIVARDGGTLVRAGQTEGSVDLARLAGLNPAGTICEIMKDDGTMARRPDLEKFAAKHDLLILSVADIIQYRAVREKLVRRKAEAGLPTVWGGEFKIVVFENDIDGKEHLALVKGEWGADEPILVRVHSECLTGDVFGSQRCDCGSQLHAAMNMIDKEGKGVLLYLRQEGRGIGLTSKIAAYKLQEKGYDTVEANIALGYQPDLRTYGLGAQMLQELGVRKMRLLTNNPKKIIGLHGFGLEIVERVAIEAPANGYSYKYLQTKKEKMGHILSVEWPETPKADMEEMKPKPKPKPKSKAEQKTKAKAAPKAKPVKKTEK